VPDAHRALRLSPHCLASLRQLARHSPKTGSYGIFTKVTKRVGGSSVKSGKQPQPPDDQPEKEAATSSTGANSSKHDAGKAYAPGSKKARTENVWLFKAPINNFIYRWVIYFAPHSQKDWASGHRFIEYVLAHDKLEEGERWVLEGLMAIRGSRNGVFFADAIAIVFWLDRGIEFLQRQEDLAIQRGDRDGGATRRQLLAMAKDPVVRAALHAMALMYLELYLPFMSAITHVDNVAEDLPLLDQAFYSALESADPAELLTGGDGDGEALMAPEYDRIKSSTRDKRNAILARIRGLCPDERALTESMLTAMLQAGASTLHHHTVERQAEQHDLTTPDKRLGSAAAPTEPTKEKLRPAAVTNHDAERSHAVMRMVRTFAPTLLHRHLSGRMRNHIDRPAQWLLQLVRDKHYSMEQVFAIVRITVAAARKRAKASGGRTVQYKKIGLEKMPAEEALLDKLRQKRKEKEEKEDNLRSVKRAEKVSELQGLSRNELLQQINIFRILDGVDVVLYKSSTKLARLETLADLIEERFPPGARDRSQEWIEAEAETKAKAARNGPGGATSSRGQRTDGRTWPLHETEPIQGARMRNGRRQYLVRWQDENPDAPGEAWMTYEHYNSLCVNGQRPSECCCLPLTQSRGLAVH
jgi:hypothetical protein